MTNTKESLLQPLSPNTEQFWIKIQNLQRIWY